MDIGNERTISDIPSRSHGWTPRVRCAGHPLLGIYFWEVIV
jgi:hypothetical protein